MTVSRRAFLARAGSAALLSGSAPLLLARPALAAGTTRLGASNLDRRLGDLPVRRTYSDDLTKLPTGPVVHTFKDWDAAQATAWVRSARAGSVLGYLHEPENNIERHKTTAQAWAQHTVELSDIIARSGRGGEVRQCAVLMGWTLQEGSHRAGMLKQLLTPQVVDGLHRAGGMIGWDVFGGPRSATSGSGPHRSPDEMYGVPARFSAAKGLPWAVMETGTAQTRRSPAGEFADWWRSVFAYVRGSKPPSAPLFFLAWNPTDRDAGVFAVQDFPQSAAVWRAASQAKGFV